MDTINLCKIIPLSILILAVDTLHNDVKFFFRNVEMKIGEYNVTFEPDQEVKIFCHGWMDSIKSQRFLDLENEYLKKGLRNVIGIDWSDRAGGLYTATVDTIETISRSLADFLLDLLYGYNIPTMKIHLIGHSLGAHICGYAGQYVKSSTNSSLGRITGLDPAGPKFENAPPDKRLSCDDAIFVDVIHTDGGVLGCMKSLGHVDFFPNGGVGWQIGCGVYEISCSHNRAPIYFIESINSYKFISTSCGNYDAFQQNKCDGNDYVIMGENVNRSARGDFYLRTNNERPFALG